MFKNTLTTIFLFNFCGFGEKKRKVWDSFELTQSVVRSRRDLRNRWFSGFWRTRLACGTPQLVRSSLSAWGEALVSAFMTRIPGNPGAAEHFENR